MSEPSEFDYLSDEMQEYIINLENEKERLKEQQRWISVSERLPESGERVLARMSNFYIVIACYFDKNGYWKNDSGQEIFIVTHWQPLTSLKDEYERQKESE